MKMRNKSERKLGQADDRARRGPLFLLLGILSLLGSWIVGANVLDGRLVVDMLSPANDVAQAFYSSKAVWTEAQSTTLPTQAGATRVVFPLSESLGRYVRFDPGRQRIPYKIVNTYWELGAFKQEVSFGSLANLNPKENLTVSENSVTVVSPDGDPQLGVPIPSFWWRIGAIAAFVTPMGIYLLLCFALVARRRIGPEAIATGFLATVFAYFVFGAIKFGVWLPDFDDLRYVGVGPPRFNLLNDGYSWLYAVGNDSIAFVGTLFDYIVLKLTNFNFGVLRLFALTVLGCFLVIQLKIIKIILSPNAFARALGIVLMIYVLGTTTYWGTTVIAYQQFLPVFFGTWIIYLVVKASRTGLSRGGLVVVTILGILACLSYISGPLIIGAIAVAIISVRAGFYRSGNVDSFIRAAVLLGSVSVSLLALSIFLLAKVEGSLLAHNHAVASIYPTDRRFWIFFDAQFGKAIGYVGVHAAIDALIMMFLLVPFFIFILMSIIRMTGRQRNEEFDSATFVVVFAGICSIFYCTAVAFGRAGFIPINVDSGTAVMIAKARFHYWWIASLVPYFFIGWLMVYRLLASRWSTVSIVALALVLFLFLVPKSLTGWNYFAALHPEQDRVAAGAYCAVQNYESPRGKGDFFCPDITGVEVPLRQVMETMADKKLELYERMKGGDFSR